MLEEGCRRFCEPIGLAQMNRQEENTSMDRVRSGKYKNGKGTREVSLNIVILGEETVVCLLMMNLSQQSAASLPCLQHNIFLVVL